VSDRPESCLFDMTSSHRMKYPLTIIAQMLRELGGKLGIGYDIMCAFWKTLLCSWLGNQVIKSG
jgi:hypothetical protein